MTTPMLQALTEENREALLAQALEILDLGGLVCLPTETVYGIGGRSDRPEVETQLRAWKGERGDKPFSLHCADQDQVFALGKRSPAAQRLADAFWPGPLTLVLPKIEGPGSLAFRVVDQDFTRELLRRCEVPLLLSSANRSSEEPPTDPQAALAAVGDVAELIVDAGPCPLARSSSVVRIDKTGSLEILREGALESQRILARAATLVLFLCSGNTCRSPMAEGLARAHYAQILGVEVDQLLDRGLLVASAGCSTMHGMPASPHAIEAMNELGIDISDHLSRPVEPALLARASRIYCMGRSHLALVHAIVDQNPHPGELDALPPALLDPGAEIPDPFGGSLTIYRETRDHIRQLIPPTFPFA